MEGKETALGLCLIYTLMFVFSLYIWEESRDRSLRDYPSVVIKRFLSVFMSTFLSGVMTLWFGVTFDEFGVPLKDPLKAIWGTIVGLLITQILFLGPLYLEYLTWHSTSFPDFRNVLIIRNLIVGPVTEEIVFRGFVISVLIKGGFDLQTSFVLSIVFFALAHAHHIYHSKPIEVIFILFQTTIFGALSAFLFVRTETIFASTISHTFCNFMGFPGLDTNNPQVNSNKKKIIICYIIGLVGFFTLMFPLTEYPFSSPNKVIAMTLKQGSEQNDFK